VRNNRYYGLIIWLGLCSLLLSMMVGCAPQGTTPLPAATETPVAKGGQVTLAMSSPPDNFNAINTSSAYGWLNVQIVFATLVRFDDHNNFIPYLAESWDVSDDYTTFTFHLNPEARWHDGVPVTSEDVVFTISAISHPRIENNRGAHISVLEGLSDGGKRAGDDDPLEGVKAIDEHTVQFITKSPTDPLSLLEIIGMRIRIIPKHVLENLAPEDLVNAEFWMAPTVGSGPFKFVRYEVDQYIEYERNDDFFLGRPLLDKFIVKIVNQSTLAAELQKGTVDITKGGEIPLDDWELVQELDNVDAYGYEDAGYQYMVMNCDPSGPFADSRVRQALAYGINRQLMVDRLLKGQGSICQGPMIPGTSYYNADVEGYYPYDPEKARSLLSEAGWDPEKELRFIVPTGNLVRELSADIIEANLADIGVKAKIDKMDFSMLMSLYADGDYDLGLMGWTGTLDPDVRWQFHSDGQYNFSHYSSQKLDELLEQGVSVAATTERKQFYDKFQVQLLEEAPIVPLYRPLQLMAADKRLHNASGIPTQEGLLRNIEQWWVGGGE